MKKVGVASALEKSMAFLRLQMPYVMLIVSCGLVATGWVDIDWMIVTYKFDMWNGSQGYWEFCPFLKVNWWIAYELSLIRLMLGSGMLGYLICWMRREVKK